jgi:hypothetical protein
MILAGLPFLLLTLRIYLEPGFAVQDAPVGSGVAILAVGSVTAAAWLVRIVSGRREPPRSLHVLGGGALVVAVVTGAWLLSEQVALVMTASS